MAMIIENCIIFEMHMV